MKQIIILLVIISTSLVFGNDLFSSRVTEMNSLEVKSIFTGISSHDIVVASFTQDKYLKKFSRSIFSSGTFIFDKEKGLAWDIKTPFPSITVLTEDRMLQKSSNGESRVLSAEGNDSFLRFSTTIQSIFMGNYEIIFKDYDIYYLGSTKVEWEIGLIPKDSSLKAVIKSFELGGNEFISKFKINEINGDSVTYNFTNINYPNKLTLDESNIFR